MSKINVLTSTSVEIPNWFERHKEEKQAFEIINYMKHKLIPSFIHLSKKYKILIETQSDEDHNQLLMLNQSMINILDEFEQEFDLNEQFFKDMNNEFDQIFDQKEFENNKWSKIFSACELCSISILSALINYLVQSSHVMTETGCLEIEDCVYFFKTSLDSSLRHHYHIIRQVVWTQRLKFRICNFFINPLLCFIEKLIPIPKLHLQIMRTFCIEIIESFINKQRYLNKYDKKMQTLLIEQRYSLLLTKARIIVKQFIIEFLESLISTLIQFWIVILSFSEKDVQELGQIDKFLGNTRKIVSEAYHQFTFFSSQKLRPFGFILIAILKDLLEKDKFRSKYSQKIRSELQDCFSLLLNWLFEFITNCPRPFQSRLDGFSWASNFYQSMIESLTDFKALYKVSKLFTQKIASSDKKKLLDESNYGPWNLLETLENYFAI